MTRWIVAGSIRFRLLVVAVAVATMVVGANRLRSMPVDVLPEFVPPTVEIQTEALGLSAAEVEQLITVPMEQDLLNGVAFLDDIRSQSVPGLSRILLVFEPGTNLFRARQVVAERLTQAHALPQVSKPPQMLQPLSSTNRVLMIGLSSEKVSALEMSVQARWTIAPRLVGVPGVANVAIWGQQDRQLQVQVDPEHLRAKRVSLGQVIETTANSLWVSPLTFVEASTPGTGGFIDTPNQRLGIQHLSPISTPADLSQVRVEDTPGRNLQLGDVAKVVESHQPLIGDAVVNDGRGLLLVIEKFPEANSLEVTRGVEDAIRTMQPGLPGFRFDTNGRLPTSNGRSTASRWRSSSA
jgi:Cu/Ag efflux pump CusA